MESARTWKNSSVRALAEDRDPVTVVTSLARQLVAKARKEGWSGPPFNPFDLAERMGVPVVARGDLRDAQLVPDGGGVRIEFNPTRPLSRVRFSVAHELAHTLFPDYQKEVRQRLSRSEMSGSDWELEMLCNLAAAEFLLPPDAFPELEGEAPTVNRLVELSEDYQVSPESVMIRLATLTRQHVVAFAASPTSPETNAEYRVEYAIPSSQTAQPFSSGTELKSSGVLQECTAVGYTAIREESWPSVGDVQVQCLGIPPHPGHRYPRVAGLLLPPRRHHSEGSQGLGTLTYLRGNVTDPRPGGRRILAHVVNDKTPSWGGGGFAPRAAAKWPGLQDQFRAWANRGNLQLGRTHLYMVSDDLWIASLVAQRGYRQLRSKPLLQYRVLEACLRELADVASREDASIHMPLMGTGQGGGDWRVVSAILKDALIRQGVDVLVYVLPGVRMPDEGNEPQDQPTLF